MKIRMSNIRLDSESGSVTCEECGETFGVIHKKGVPFFYLQTVCRCGSNGYLIWGEQPENTSSICGDFSDGKVLCPECGSVVMSKWQNPRFAISVICRCGRWISGHRLRERKPEEELAARLIHK